MTKTKSNRVPKTKISGAFPTIECITYEGPKSTNPLAFKHYNAGEIVEGRTMREHLRFSVVYWHTFRGTGSDPFGGGTMLRPWDDGSNTVGNAQNRVRAAFEFIETLGAPYYAWHDRDVAPEGKTLAETNKNFDAVAKTLKAEQKRTGIKLLWGTANLFSHHLFYAHIGGMDAFARGLKIASAIRQDGRLAEFVKQRYASWDSGIGAKIESGKASLKEIEAYILKKGDVAKNVSGRQEFLENLINEFI